MHAALAFLSIALGGLGTKRVTRAHKVSMSELSENFTDARDLSKSRDEDSSEVDEVDGHPGCCAGPNNVPCKLYQKKIIKKGIFASEVSYIKTCKGPHGWVYKSLGVAGSRKQYKCKRCER